MDTPQDISTQFARDGYYLATGVYSDDTLDALEQDFDRIVHQLQTGGEDVNARWGGETMDKLDGGKSTVVHTHSVHRYSSVWLRAMLQEPFLDVTRAILGPDVLLHHTKLFHKPPREGAPFPMHQDWWYFPTKDNTMIAATLFLSDANAESGGFSVYPGSHRLGRVDNSAGLQKSEMLEKYPLDKATPITAQRGDILFFSYFTLHGSTPNRSQNPRKTVLIQMLAGTDIVEHNPIVNHLNDRLVLCGVNHHMTRAEAAMHV